jgi:Flp pilus assembly protein TadG
VRRLLRRLHGDQAGQATVEFSGILMWLLLAAVFIWQMLLVTWAFNQASNAARTASRVDGRGGDARKAGRNALNPNLRGHADVVMSGERATVKVRIPILVPGLDTKDMLATGHAELPRTTS